jgi:hypothetical protein
MWSQPEQLGANGFRTYGTFWRITSVAFEYQGFGFQINLSLEITRIYFVIKGLLILRLFFEELKVLLV